MLSSSFSSSSRFIIEAALSYSTAISVRCISCRSLTRSSPPTVAFAGSPPGATFRIFRSASSTYSSSLPSFSTTELSAAAGSTPGSPKN